MALTLRAWQAEALPIAIDNLRRGGGGVLACTMGSGKSVLIASLLKHAVPKLKPQAIIVVTTPPQALVAQLHETIAGVVGQANVGKFYGQKKQIRPVTITCNDSMMALAARLAERGDRVACWIADEAHRSETSDCIAAIGIMAPRTRLGVTATAFRSSKKESLTLFNEVIYKYSIADALRDKVVVPYDVVNWDGSKREKEDVDGICLDMIRRTTGPGIVSALSIEDAKKYAAYLTEHGIPAKAIHSKLSDREKKASIADLESGAIRALVHISMLAEGVDFPWLRWLCLRRAVGARVRFAQEVGRILRASAGKERALLLDPHDLCREHSMFTSEAVGQVLEQEDPEDFADLDPEEVARRERELADREAVAVSEVEQWARTLARNMELAGLCEPYESPHDPDWREQFATAKQLDTMSKMKGITRWMPADLREPLKKVIDRGERLPRGAASDIITVLLSVSRASAGHRKAAARTGDWSHRWPWPSAVGVPELPPTALLDIPFRTG